jgi:hypothetical protein
MVRAVLGTLVALAFAGSLAAAPQAIGAPPSFFATTAGGRNFDLRSSGELNRREQTWDEIQATGVKVYRMRIDWNDVSYPKSCGSGNYDFGQLYDDLIRRAAQHEITVIADLYGMPGGCETGNPQYPVPGSSNYTTWTEPNGFVARVVKRYGYNGSFWSANPSVPYHPIEAWEVWNEVNAPGNNPPGGVQPQKYAKFLIDTSTTIRKAQAEVAPGASPRILLGGLSTADESWMHISEFYSVMYTKPPTSGPGAYTTEQLHAAYDGLGLHPYAQAAAWTLAKERVQSVRGTMNLWGDSAKTIWITELGWPVGEFGMTQKSQAEYLKESFTWFKKEASSLKIELATWFFLRDLSKAELGWAALTGLKDADGNVRPSWCEFLKLNGRSCAMKVAGGTTPSISRDPGSGYTFMAYRSEAGQVAYSYKSPSEGWVSSVLGGTVATNTSPRMIRSESPQHVFIAYRDNNGRIGYWYWVPGEGWKNGILGGTSPGDAAAGSSPSLIWEPNFTAIYYRNTSGGISYWYWTSTEGWVKLNLGGSVAANTSPSVSRDPGSGYTFVAYTSAAGRIGYWYWAPGGSWVNSEFGGIPSSTNTSPSVVRNESAQHVFIAYRNTSSHISYWYWTSSEGWVNGSIPEGPGLSVAPGASPNLTWDPNYTGISYRNSASGVSMAYWVWPTGWSSYTVPTYGWAQSDIGLTRDPATGNSSLAYADQNQHISNLTWLYNVTGGWYQITQ